LANSRAQAKIPNSKEPNTDLEVHNRLGPASWVTVAEPDFFISLTDASGQGD